MTEPLNQQLQQGLQSPQAASIAAGIVPAPPAPRKMVREEIFSLPEGEIRLVWHAPMSVESYGEVKQWLELVKLKMQRALSTMTLSVLQRDGGDK